MFMSESKLEKRKQKISSLLYAYLVEGFKGSNTREEIIKNTFILLLQDFLDEKLKIKPDLYTLEAFAGNMLFVVSTHNEIKKYDLKLSNALDIAADITFYYTKGKKSKNMNDYNRIIQNLKDYYEAEKSIL